MKIKFSWMRVLFTLAISMSISACSYIPWFGDDEKVEIEIREPNELSEFIPEVLIQQNWQVSVGGDAEEKSIQLQPHVFDDKIAFTQTEGKISVHDVVNGRVIVSGKVSHSVSAGVGGNAQYLVVGTHDGVVIAINSNNGSEAWSANVTSEVVSVAHAPNDVVVIRTNDNRILGLSTSTGEKLWTATQTPPALTLRGASVPVVRDGVAYAGMDNGKVIAISIESGSIIWESRVSVPSGRSELERLVDVDGQIAIDDEYVYAASFHGRVVAVSRVNGQVKWARDLASISGVSVDETLVYVTDKDDNVWALEKETGVSSWKQDKFLYRQLSAPVVQDNAVLVGDFQGYIHALSKQDGRIIGRVNLSKKPIHTSSMSTNATTYVMDSNGRLASYSVISAN
ncbi:MAG: outer membrane protein assembly factor BamB [Gammaproteobacteria bacterium]|nr:outer membrane protein assembly factor BamB [Gammaproteobacteria bacterium]